MGNPIRILNLFTIMDFGGAETMVMNYYRNIDRTKVQFDFMVHRAERGTYDDEIESLGGKIFRMPPIRPWSSSSYRKAVREFYHTHSEYRIIHSHMSELGYYDFVEAEKAGIPVRICHAHNRPHGIDIKSPIRWYYKKRMMSHITHMFTCGEEAGEWLFGNKNKDGFIMLNNAIDAASFQFNSKKREVVRNQLCLDKHQLVVGHIGRFNIQKNHRFVLEIFLSLLNKQPDAVLLLIGDDNSDLGKEIHHKAKTLGINEQVRFLGLRSDIPDLLQAMDVFLFPSLFEGLSLASVEAQASGLPVLISDYVPIECKITDLVKVVSLKESAETWAEVLLYESQKPRRNTYQEIINAGFDIKNNANQLTQIYEKISNF